MKQVKIIGVPEHFNLPWHLALEEGAFAERGIELIWADVPEGTGRMTQLLQEGKADMGIILTEGLVKSISQGNPVKIVQEYVSSPLLWGIHVNGSSTKSSVAEIKEDTVAVSRMGSGSHLMAYVHAQQQGWDTNSLQFKIIDNLDGAVSYLKSSADAYFMWERFTTKPLVDEGTFKHLGNCPTPWPCFVIAATNTFIAEQPGLLKHILDIINVYTQEFKKIPSIDRTLANRYHQKLEDIQEWLSLTNWGHSQLSSETLSTVQEQLHQLGLLDEIKPNETFLCQID